MTTALMKYIISLLFLLVVSVSSRIHKLPLTDDERHYVDLTTFGFFQGGILDVHMINFKLPSGPVLGKYGFTLDRTVNDAINPYLEVHSDICILKGVEKSSTLLSPHHPAIVFLHLDFTNMRLNITCEGEVTALHLYQNRSMIPMDRSKGQSQYI
ncbi:unnamed protein product [Leptidea sinapis]|uniref:Uncharacterized protein n=1 Tax=Leptidea sinapis TaxID=189913 RepID=A0A5E4Q7S5_9NEOP|nr:unnamed protein product [Leptidea sinapis]